MTVLSKRPEFNIFPFRGIFQVSNLSLLVLFTFFITAANAQNEANMWYFGTQAGINFNNIPPTKFSNGLTNSGAENGEGVATMSDASGNILFYTDGVTVWNSTGTMPGGTGLMGSKSAIESAVAVPQPGANPNKLYYIFTVPCEEGSGAFTTGGSKDPQDGLRYSVVNMTTAAGNIPAGTKNVQVTPAGIPVTEALSAIPDNLNTGFWVICHQAGDRATSATSSNKFYAYHVRPGNVNTTTGAITFTAADIVTSSVGTGITGVPAPPATTASSNSQATMKANSCFTRIAFGFFAKSKLIEVFTFSNTTGALTGPTYSVTNFGADVNEVYGIEFSPNGKILYASILGQSGGSALYSFNVTSEVTATINTAANTSRRVTTVGAPVGELQLGPDGNIYYSHFFTNPIGGGASNAYVGRITNPNTFPGTFNDTYFTWAAADAGVASKMGLPQIYKGFVAGVGSILPGAGIAKLDSVCVGETFDLQGTYSGTGTNWKWNIDANLNATIDYTVQNPSGVSYATAGTYTVTLNFDDATCLYPVSATEQIVVSPNVSAAGTLTCGSPTKGNVTSPNGAYTYVWYADAAMTKPVATGTTNVTIPLSGVSGNVYLRAESSASSSNTTNTLMTGTANGWDNAGGSNTATFTVNKKLVLNSFQWSNSGINWCGCPSTQTYTVTIKDAAGTTTFYTQTRTPSNNGALTTTTESPALTLAPGNYKFTVSGPVNPNLWSGCTPTSAADNALVFTGPCTIGNINYTATTYAVTGINCSAGSAVSYNCPLPVEFLSFHASAQGSTAVQLDWSTATEKDNAYFVVERSLNGIDFEAVGTVHGKGNSSSIETYLFTDNEVVSGISYYRLKQVDNNGSYSYSGIETINLDGKISVNMQPNPNNGSFSIQVSGGAEKGLAEIIVLNALGQEVYTSSLNTNISNSKSIDIQHLASGIYFVQVQSNGSRWMEKIIKE
ncbi:MAG: T9SS type A sorting domain-containing protein [Cytophagaceae bacterium]